MLRRTSSPCTTSSRTIPERREQARERAVAKDASGTSSSRGRRARRDWQEFGARLLPRARIARLHLRAGRRGSGVSHYVSQKGRRARDITHTPAADDSTARVDSPDSVRAAVTNCSWPRILPVLAPVAACPPPLIFPPSPTLPRMANNTECHTDLTTQQSIGLSVTSVDIAALLDVLTLLSSSTSRLGS